MPNSIKIAKSASEIAKYKLNLKIMFTMSTFCQSPDIMSNPVTLITAKISFLVYCSLHVFKVSSMMEPLHSVFVSFWQWRSDDAKKFRNFEIYNLPPPSPLLKWRQLEASIEQSLNYLRIYLTMLI